MFNKIQTWIVFIVLLILLTLFFYPKSVVSFPDGGWLFSSSGRICKCMGYRTPLVGYEDMGKGYKEKILLQAKCYGMPYQCSPYDTLVD